jgi:hypothetical protein
MHGSARERFQPPPVNPLEGEITVVQSPGRRVFLGERELARAPLPGPRKRQVFGAELGRRSMVVRW